jgi:hypothetical protein
MKVAPAKEEEEDANKDEAKSEEKEIQPVGQDYIEEIKNDEGIWCTNCFQNLVLTSN